MEKLWNIAMKDKRCTAPKDDSSRCRYCQRWLDGNPQFCEDYKQECI